jgi:hypothetical protein
MGGRHSQLWHRFGAALTALFLAVLTLGPSLDSLVCQGDDAVGAAHTTVTATAAVAPSGSGAERHASDDLGLCVHGHCHHAGAYVAFESPAAAAPVARMFALGVARQQVATRDRQFQLIRPPRA